MFRFWLHFHPLMVLVALTFVFSVAGVLLHWLQCRSPLRHAMKASMLTAASFVAVSTLFALFAGFLLAQVVSQKSTALRAVQTESAALQTLAIDSAASQGGEAIRAAISDYTRSVVTDEWPRMLNESGSDKTQAALFALIRTVRDGGGGGPVHTQMLTLAQKVADARAERIAIVSNHLQQFAWSALFLLGFVTQFGLGMAHVDRPGANATSIAFFSVGAVVALWLIATQDNPFRGPNPVSPAPFNAVTAALGAG